MRFSTHAVLAVALTAAHASAFQSVHVVNGGLPSALQDAIDASADGDTVLVHGGSYGGIAVLAKSITIVAEPELGTFVRGMIVASVGPSQRCVVAGLDVASDGSLAALTVQNCSGSVRFEGVRARALAEKSVDGATVDNSSDVAFVRCELQGGAQTPTPGPNYVIYPVGRGLFVNASNVAMYDSSCTGGLGQDAHFINLMFGEVPAGSGGAGVEIAGASTFFAGHDTFAGGGGGHGRDTACAHLPCGFAPTSGGDGGAGVSAAPGSNVFVLDTQSAGGLGGAGGAGGQCCPTTTWPPGQPGASGLPTAGPITPVAGTSSVLATPSVVRELNTLNVTVHGTAGDAVYLGTSILSQWSLNLGLAGVFLIGPASRRIPLGTVPGSGVLQVGLPIGALPAGIGAQNRHMQVIVRTSAGQTRLGSPATLTVLDSIY